jgi:hypothetical protein
MMEKAPIYVSKSTVKSIWQEYRIYDNRLELDTLFGMMVIPFEHIEKVEVSESEVRGLMRGDLHLKGFRPALKVDWANFVEHVVIDKSEGMIHRVLVTPDDTQTFKKMLDKALADYRR